MTDAFSRLKGRRSKLPDPPDDDTQNLRAPEAAPLETAREDISTHVQGSPRQFAAPRARIDGRQRLRKDRTEALSTKIKPHHRDLLMDLADAYDGTLSETIERAIEALEDRARKDGFLK